MAVFKYFAVDRGDLISGHSEGTEYSFEIPLQDWTPIRKRIETTKKSLSGKRQFTTLHRIERFHSFMTVGDPNASMLLNFLELESSVAAGETFYIDPYGTIAAPDNEISVKLVGDIKPRRTNTLEYSFSGKVELV